MGSANTNSLFEKIARALKAAGYYHVSRVRNTSQLVAAYTPNEETISQLRDQQHRSKHDVWTGRYQEFDLVISEWEAESCIAWVIRQPEGRQSPANIFYKSSICREFPSGSVHKILALGKLTLDAQFY